CNDLQGFQVSQSIKTNLSKIEEANILIDKTSSDFQSKIEKEYDSIDVLEFSTAEYQTEILKSLKEFCSLLKDKIKSDNWTNQKIVSNEFKGFIKAVEKIIQKKKEYFNNENDIFTTEFNWFQFFNGLPKEEKILVKELKGKKDWRKSLLIHYLNSILVSSANVDLPTNDSELIDLNGTLSGLEREQLKF